ncbi:hypothetical protein N431DRAFT_431228 [Stipitochalara longipes BDJ]|nr:hypothetical protein N431DRAFT_431228 [Stipitochalara longipes BDJ]
MASHQLAIAKASFSAGLLRPDPTSLTRDQIAHFHSLLNETIVQCSPRNVQKCKQWILENIAQSTARFTALGKYLTALTTSFVGSDGQTTSNREPSVKRKRMHVLYLVNDILYHSKFRINNASICGKVQPILVSLFGSAASFKGSPRHQRKVLDLLDIWDEKGYYSKDYIDKLREAVKNAAEAGEHAEGSSTGAEKDQGLATKTAKSAPYVMPAVHGDPSTPWFDLPAGNLMPHIVPNSTRPINPDMIKPLQFVAGPADENLVVAVKGLLEDVQTIFGVQTDQEEKASLDIDELGQPIILDEITGEVIDGEGYYGWSRSFCEKMKRRKKGLDIPGKDEGRGRSRSRSSTPGARKRRYSDSDDGSSRGDYRSARRRRSYSSSRSPSPEDARKNGNSGSGSRRSYSRSPRRSSSPRRPENLPRDSRPPQGLPPRPSMIGIPPPPFQQPFNPNFPPPPPPPLQNFNGTNQQQYGAWPPPPPPPLQNFNGTNPQQYGSWPPPPPPGNPPNQQQQQYGYAQQQQQQGSYQAPSGPGGWQQGNGRGYNGNWNGPRGRGNYRGRGGW